MGQQDQWVWVTNVKKDPPEVEEKRPEADVLDLSELFPTTWINLAQVAEIRPAKNGNSTIIWADVQATGLQVADSADDIIRRLRAQHNGVNPDDCARGHCDYYAHYLKEDEPILTHGQYHGREPTDYLAST